MLPIIPTPGRVETGSYPWLPSEFEPNLDDMRPYLQELFFPIDSMLRYGQDMTLWEHRKRARGWEVCPGDLRLRRFWVHGEFSSRWIPNHCRSVLSPVAAPRAAGCVLPLSSASCVTSTESGITRADFWRESQVKVLTALIWWPKFSPWNPCKSEGKNMTPRKFSSDLHTTLGVIHPHVRSHM